MEDILIYLLLMTVVMLLLISLYLFKFDVMHPSVIISEVFIFSIACAIYNVNTWDINLHWRTYFILCFSIALFCISGYIATILTSSIFLNKGMFYEEKKKLKPIEVPKFQILVSIIFSVVTTFLYVKEVIRISKSVGGGGDWSRTMYYYRQATSYGVLGEDGMSGYVGHLYDLMIALAYVFLFIVVHNLLIEGRKFNKLLLIPIVISCVATFLSAARIQLLYFLMASLSYYFILLVKFNQRRINIKQIFKLMIMIIAVLSLFVSLRSVIGRGMSEKSASDPLYYFTVYAGGPIPLFDDFLKNPPDKSNVFGKELFFRMNRFIGGLFRNDKLIYISHKEFRYAPTGYSLGNVYTAFRSYLFDFGYFGLVIFTVITSVFYSAYYTYLKLKKFNYAVDTSLIVYGYLIPGVFLMSISERLFSIYFSVNSFKMIVFIYFSVVFLTRKRFIIGRKY